MNATHFVPCVTRLSDWFRPGNIIRNAYWRAHDRVVRFDVHEDSGQWMVTVERVEMINGRWVAYEPARQHCTMPGANDALITY